MLRIAHCLDNRLTDGGKVVSLTHQPRSTLQKHYFSALVRLEGLGKLKKLIHLFESRNCDPPACSIVPQPLSYRIILIEHSEITRKQITRCPFVFCPINRTCQFTYTGR
jgi:hypothetical protein